MAALHSDLNADLGCRRNTSIYAHLTVSGRIGRIRDILALYWGPDVVVFHLHFALRIFYKQPQRIPPIWNIPKDNFCVLAEMSDVDIN